MPPSDPQNQPYDPAAQPPAGQPGVPPQPLQPAATPGPQPAAPANSSPLKIDDNLLAELGLAQLPDSEKQSLRQHIYETLEMRVGMRLADQMTNEQLDEFETYFNAKDDAGAFRWLETNFPNYKDIVADEFNKLKAEVGQSAQQILAAAQQQAVAGAAPAQPAMQQPQAPPMPQQPAYQPPAPADPYQSMPPQQPEQPQPPMPDPYQPPQPLAQPSDPPQWPQPPQPPSYPPQQPQQ